MFDVLYEEFLKLQISRFYGANSKTHYLHKDLFKQEFDEIIKAAMSRKYKVYIKKKHNIINMDMDIDDDYKKVQLLSLMKCLKIMIQLQDIMKKKIIQLW